MDEAGGGGGLEPAGGVERDGGRVERVERTVLLDDRAEVPPGQVFHGEPGAPVELADVVDRDHIGVGEGGGGARLAGEAGAQLGVVAMGLGEDLERDLAPQPLVLGEVDAKGPVTRDV